MTTFLLYSIQAIFLGVLELPEKLIEQNMEEVLTYITIFWNIKEKTATYQVETDAFSNVLFISSKKSLPKNISTSYNHILEELML